ncbi:ABC transporter ATP-binding protein [Noviherbaspirillum autotrophicum]|uniref:Nitrate ABC transporter ATP-binding protein n=1 Tax=Noviherbaspirillum autotrophicum TaxID=709839 RepID=A0A0C2BLA4_9BURK|nr:nitrate/sulfonate/bicarbonate ABC transporter ATP-binding protein [Noviherbaspirillum autotrophicum]KIF81669.1 nitrate ABC transporter ATP-binding protein [Noviherbaspirillum autotrophicum]KIF82030.1 nitrate ABC transporter ATP-binding protein [Noviherbaspirillum autotrophicum]KIF84084.1 nitrate ABC transporter ATP-binding protein [Noviherbaspirillum autotrophicum]
MNNKSALVELNGVAKSFRSADGAPRKVLDDVNFSLAEGEIVALLGKSGSGKSTLLRIIAGLIPADAGKVTYRGQRIQGPASGITMVFQSFALFPWLTVQQNVALGLEAQGIAPEERAKRADAMLELIGLAGFGGALPRELSGGMRQRVGIARALVTDPDVLLMDEAFSALDVLTGETLRSDILDLWDSNRIPTKGLLVVSHNIEEAVMMADRIIILASDPGRIRNEITIGLERPRNVDSPEVRSLIDEVYGLMTMRPVQEPVTGTSPPITHPGYRLPDTDVTRIEGVLDLLANTPFNGRADLPHLAEESELQDEELFPTYEALGMLGLAQVEKGDITLTPLGVRYAEAEHTLRQEIFGQQLLTHVPLASHIRQQLEAEPSGALPEKQFLELLEEFLKADEAKRVLEIAIEWGRYGEAYEYDFHTGRLKLPDQAEE